MADNNDENYICFCFCTFVANISTFKNKINAEQLMYNRNYFSGQFVYLQIFYLTYEII